MIRRLFTLFLSMTVLALFAIPAMAELSVEEIVYKANNRELGKNKIAEIEMIIERGSKQKIRSFSQWQLASTKAKGAKKMIRFIKPANLKGTGFLTWENKDRDDDQWLYMSSKKLLRRIASGDKTGAFMGSDLTYEDMGVMKVDDRDHKILDTPTVNGRECWLVESTLKQGIKSAYYLAKTLIDQKTFIALKMEMFDSKGKLIKSIEVKDYKEVDGVWTMMETVVTPNNKKGSTTLKTISVSYGMNLPDSKFKKESLKAF